MDIISILSNIISNSLPSVAIMATGLVAIALAHGIGGIKVNEGERKFLLAAGYILLPTGALLTLIVSVLQILTSYPSNLLNMWNFISPSLSYVFSWPFLLFISLGLLVAITVRNFRNRQIERGFSLQAVPVVIGELGAQIAGLQVVNTGNGSFNCIAKLTRISYIPEETSRRTKTVSVDVNTVNPRGYSLRWDDERWYVRLDEKFPRTIELVMIPDYHKREIRFKFANREYSELLPIGIYEIEIELVRLKSGKHISMSVVKDILVAKIFHKQHSTYTSGDGIELKWAGKC